MPNARKKPVQDLWQAAELAFVTVAADLDVVQRSMSDVGRMTQSNPRVVLLDLSTGLI